MTPTTHDSEPATAAGGSATDTAAVTVSVNGVPREFAPDTTLDTVVAALTRAPSGVAAAVNETVVPRTRWSATLLCGGDRIEILTAVQGG